jgi:hypothetical protein
MSLAKCLMLNTICALTTPNVKQSASAVLNVVNSCVDYLSHRVLHGGRVYYKNIVNISCRRLQKSSLLYVVCEYIT